MLSATSLLVLFAFQSVAAPVAGQDLTRQLGNGQAGRSLAVSRGTAPAVAGAAARDQARQCERSWYGRSNDRRRAAAGSGDPCGASANSRRGAGQRARPVGARL